MHATEFKISAVYPASLSVLGLIIKKVIDERIYLSFFFNNS